MKTKIKRQFWFTALMANFIIAIALHWPLMNSILVLINGIYVFYLVILALRGLETQ